MKRSSTIFLRGVVLAIGLVVLGLCIFALPAEIRTPGTEDYRPIFFGMYITAIPFFVALYHTLKLLSYIDNGQAFSQLSVGALKHIKYCAVTISALFAAGLPYLYFVAEKDDAPDVVALGLVVIFASIAIATFAAVLQKILGDAIAIKTENDLTV
ncbi:MAG TPA: DUF2975 domain-containing protein [Candidatus Saccharimonadia bacterium]|nr:DUF2975 domain-containing protein [Candidatus Saccharimonadia bacterium]